MNSDKTGNAGSSAATSPTAPPSALSESEYLLRQADLAKQAMAATLHEAADRLRESVDVRALMNQHPWVSVGAGLVAGFVAGSAITPSRDESLQERIRSLFPEQVVQPPAPQHVQAAATAAAQQSKPGLMQGLSASLLDAVKTALVSTISSAVTAKVHQEGGDNGHSGEPSRDPTAPGTAGRMP